MRGKIDRYIRKASSGFVNCGEKRQIIHELKYDAEQRYDEELAKGASEQEAFDAAAASLGDVEELLDSAKIYRKIKIKPIYLLPILLIALANVGSNAKAIKGAESIDLIIAAAGLLLFIVGTTLLCVRCFTKIFRKGWVAIPLAVAVIGVSLIQFGLFGMPFARSALKKLSPSSGSSNIGHIDFIDRIDNIESIKLIEVTRSSRFLNKTNVWDNFDYRVLEVFPSESWEEILTDLKEVNVYRKTYLVTGFNDESRYFLLGNSQRAINQGDIALKITFIEPYSGSTYCIISDDELVCDVMGSDGTKILQCQLGGIDTGDWYEFQKKYMPQE